MVKVLVEDCNYCVNVGCGCLIMVKVHVTVVTKIDNYFKTPPWTTQLVRVHQLDCGISSAAIAILVQKLGDGEGACNFRQGGDEGWEKGGRC